MPLCICILCAFLVIFSAIHLHLLGQPKRHNFRVSTNRPLQIVQTELRLKGGKDDTLTTADSSRRFCGGWSPDSAPTGYIRNIGRRKRVLWAHKKIKENEGGVKEVQVRSVRVSRNRGAGGGPQVQDQGRGRRGEGLGGRAGAR
jgi:hypothetical protein